MKRFALLLVLLLQWTARAEDWPGWLGPKRDGSTSEKISPWKNVEVVWKKPLGEGHGGPIVADGKVLIFTRTPGKDAESLLAFDAVKGDLLWEQSYPRAFFKNAFGAGPRSTPQVVDGKVYTTGITGLLSCFDLAKGTQLWQVDTLKEYGAKILFFGVSGSPIVEGNAVIVNVGGKGASIVAFDKNTGKELWKALDDKASYSSPIAAGKGTDRQVIFLTGANLVGLAPADGKVLWQYTFKDAISESSTTPMLSGDTLLGSSITLGTVGLTLKNNTATKAWMEPALTSYFSTPVAVDKDHTFLVTGTNPLSFTKTKMAILHCIETSSGKVLWKRDKVGTYHASLLRTGDDKLLLLEENGSLVLLEADPKEYKELARGKICGTTWAHPAVANGLIYIRDGKELTCVRLVN